MLEARARFDPDAPVAEPIQLQVRGFMEEQGYVVGSPNGHVESLRDPIDGRLFNTWGLLLPVERKPRMILGRRLGSVQPKRPFIGQVRLSPWEIDLARLPKGVQWIIEVYGIDYLERMKELALQLSERFNRRIGIRLGDENPRLETKTKVF